MSCISSQSDLLHGGKEGAFFLLVFVEMMVAAPCYLLSRADGRILGMTLCDSALQRGSAPHLSPFPTDIRPRAMSIAVTLLLTAISPFFLTSVVLPNCPSVRANFWLMRPDLSLPGHIFCAKFVFVFSQISDDSGCVVATVTWSIMTLVAVMMAVLAVFRPSRKLLAVVIPAAVFAIWILDSHAYVFAAATSSRALYVDAHGGAPIVIRGHTIAGMITAMTAAAVFPQKLDRGPLWVSLLVGLRLAVTTANYVSVIGVGVETLALSLPTSVMGCVAAVSLVRPSWGECGSRTATLVFLDYHHEPQFSFPRRLDPQFPRHHYHFS